MGPILVDETVFIPYRLCRLIFLGWKWPHLSVEVVSERLWAYLQSPEAIDVATEAEEEQAQKRVEQATPKAIHTEVLYVFKNGDNPARLTLVTNFDNYDQFVWYVKSIWKDHWKGVIPAYRAIVQDKKTGKILDYDDCGNLDEIFKMLPTRNPASVTKFEVGKTYWDNSLTNHNRVFTYKVIKRTEKTVTVEDERFGKTKTYRVRIMDNHECFIAGTIESSYLTPEHIKVGEIYYSRDYQYQFVKRKIGVDQHEELNFEPVGKRNNEDIAISELVTLIADAGYTVPENIINGKDKQATLEHLTIIAEAAGVIEPVELYK